MSLQLKHIPSSESSIGNGDAEAENLQVAYDTVSQVIAFVEGSIHSPSSPLSGTSARCERCPFLNEVY